MERVKVKFEVIFPTPISAEELLYLGMTVQNVLSLETSVLETARVGTTPTFSKAVYLVKDPRGCIGIANRVIVESVIKAWSYGARIGQVAVRWIAKEWDGQNG